MSCTNYNKAKKGCDCSRISVTHTHAFVCKHSVFLEASNVEINFFTKRHIYALIQKQHTLSLSSVIKIRFQNG